MLRMTLFREVETPRRFGKPKKEIMKHTWSALDDLHGQVVFNITPVDKIVFWNDKRAREGIEDIFPKDEQLPCIILEYVNANQRYPLEGSHSVIDLLYFIGYAAVAEGRTTSVSRHGMLELFFGYHDLEKAIGEGMLDAEGEQQLRTETDFKLIN